MIGCISGGIYWQGALKLKGLKQGLRLCEKFTGNSESLIAFVFANHPGEAATCVLIVHT
jgi:hypothetical protein